MLILLANLLYGWNLVLAVGGLFGATVDGATLCEQQLRVWLYSSGIVNLVATVIVAAAFNATHCFYGDDGDHNENKPISWRRALAYRLPFITLGLFYLIRVIQSLCYSVPILSLCLYVNLTTTTQSPPYSNRSFAIIVLFMQCVTYVLMPVAACAYCIYHYIKYR